MSEVLNVIVKEDDSVSKKLTKRALKLQEKYYKKRKINEFFLRKKTPIQKAMTILVDFFAVMLAVTCGFMCFCNIASRVQGLTPSIAGYSTLRVISGSMRASGFEVDESVMVRCVEIDSLKEGDIIAFYEYRQSAKKFDKLDTQKI